MAHTDVTIKRLALKARQSINTSPPARNSLSEPVKLVGPTAPKVPCWWGAEEESLAITENCLWNFLWNGPGTEEATQEMARPRGTPPESLSGFSHGTGL